MWDLWSSESSQRALVSLGIRTTSPICSKMEEQKKVRKNHTYPIYFFLNLHSFVELRMHRNPVLFLVIDVLDLLFGFLNESTQILICLFLFELQKTLVTHRGPGPNDDKLFANKSLSKSGDTRSDMSRSLVLILQHREVEI